MKVQGPLDELAVFLCAPARSGVYLTRGELIALARATETSLRVGERAWMLADVLKATGSPAGLQAALSRLRAFAEAQAAEYRGLVAASPAAGPALAPWVARAEATAAKLAQIEAEVGLG